MLNLKPNEKILALAKKETLIPVCPEQLGGLPTPRKPAEGKASGNDILDKKNKVVNNEGQDLTEEFIRGAEETLKIAKLFNITEAILKQKSPSCGCGKIYDGTFKGNIIKGDGRYNSIIKEKQY